MLAKEVRARRRYSHVVRMRTDTIAYFDWGAVHQFHEIIPPLSQVVSGPGFNNDRNAWYMHDVFWIAARAAASNAFVGFAHSLESHVDRKDLCLYLNCSWPPNVASNRRGGECFQQVFGPNSVFVEIREYPFTLNEVHHVSDT